MTIILDNFIKDTTGYNFKSNQSISIKDKIYLSLPLSNNYKIHITYFPHSDEFQYTLGLIDQINIKNINIIDEQNLNKKWKCYSRKIKLNKIK